jgi:hypothetical protein
MSFSYNSVNYLLSHSTYLFFLHGVLCMSVYCLFWQVMSVKALGTSLKLTFEGNNQLVYPQTWFFMLVVAICVVMQMNYLNKVCYLTALKISILAPSFQLLFVSI